MEEGGASTLEEGALPWRVEHSCHGICGRGCTIFCPGRRNSPGTDGSSCCTACLTLTRQGDVLVVLLLYELYGTVIRQCCGVD